MSSNGIPWILDVTAKKRNPVRDEYDELINQMQHQAYLDMVNAEREAGIDIL